MSACEIINGYTIRVLDDPPLVAIHRAGNFRHAVTVTVPPLRDFSYPAFFTRELGVTYTEDARSAIEVAILAKDSLAAVRLACWHGSPR